MAQLIIDFDNNETYTRFWSKVDICEDDECWNWMASHNPETLRPMFRINTILVYAYRMAYALHHKRQLTTKYILHSCDNGSCCNPAHLREGTAKENIEDMMKRGRANNEAKVSKKFTPEQINRIRQLAETGMTILDISRLLDTSFRAVRNIVLRHTYRYV